MRELRRRLVEEVNQAWLDRGHLGLNRGGHLGLAGLGRIGCKWQTCEARRRVLDEGGGARAGGKRERRMGKTERRERGDKKRQSIISGHVKGNK
jgi:hypothetical protein